jgi:hypothetical protein
MIFFIITKVGGKCECNGHSNVCIPSDPEVIISTSSYSIYLKGQCHEIFFLPLSTTPSANFVTSTAGVVDTGLGEDDS